MRAVVSTDFGESEVVELPKPSPGDGEVLVDVDRVQLSVTECQLYRGQELSQLDTVRRVMHEGDGRLFGHEFCGVVEATGDGVAAFDAGDRVYAPAKISCGDCSYCSAGYTQLCGAKETIGIGSPGALAEYVSLPADPLYALPDGVSDAAGAAMQPLASALVCVHDADVEPGDVVAVVGCGVMGYQCGQLALERGAGEVIAVDVVPEKLELAREQGMTAVDARGADLEAVVAEATDGVGADVVFEAVGGEQSHVTDGEGPLASAFRTVRSGGTVLQVGQLVGEMEVDPTKLREKSISWINPRFGVLSTGPNADTGAVAPALVAAGRVAVEPYITHELSGLDEFERAVEMTLHKEEYDALGPPQIVV